MESRVLSVLVNYERKITTAFGPCFMVHLVARDQRGAFEVVTSMAFESEEVFEKKNEGGKVLGEMFAVLPTHYKVAELLSRRPSEGMI